MLERFRSRVGRRWKSSTLDFVRFRQACRDLKRAELHHSENHG